MNTTATTAVVTPFTQNNNKQQKQTAKEVIAANVQALIEQLEQGHSEALTAYLTAMGRFHNYSFGNILEIARQKPDATRVAGLYAWNQLGRKVMKGEHGIRILAPVIGVRRKKDEEAEKDIRKQNQAVLVGFLHPALPRQRSPAHRELGSDPEDLRRDSLRTRKPRSGGDPRTGTRTGASQLTATLKMRTASRRPLNSPPAPPKPIKGEQPMNANTATEYRNLPLAVLTESATNPRRIFEDSALKELAASIQSQGVLSPLLVRPLTDQSFEIVAGARRYRAAQMAEVATVPVRIVNLTDAEALEAQLIENLQRRDVHPLEEAQGFKALLNLEDPKYSIEQIAAKVGKSPAYCAARVRLTELAASVVEAFYAEEIGVGHALLLAKLQPAQQEQALANCFREEWNGAGAKAKRILLPVRHLQQWIEHNVLLLLKLAPFNKRDPQLVSVAGSCVDCPKRTGHNKLLFADASWNSDACKLCGIWATASLSCWLLAHAHSA